VRDWKAWEVFVAEWYVFCCPTSKNDAGIPGTLLDWSYTLNGLSDQAHDIVGVVVELFGF
jgi:hypothetical protein